MDTGTPHLNFLLTLHPHLPTIPQFLPIPLLHHPPNKSFNTGFFCYLQVSSKSSKLHITPVHYRNTGRILILLKSPNFSKPPKPKSKSETNRNQNQKYHYPSEETKGLGQTSNNLLQILLLLRLRLLPQPQASLSNLDHRSQEFSYRTSTAQELSG